jgi:glycosyltransferase involved in cell wall biosynthesis
VLLNIAARVNGDRFRSIAAIPAAGALQEALEAAGVRTHVVSSRPWWDLRFPYSLARLVRSEGVDLIHSHLPDSNFYSCLAGLLSGCRTLATYHSVMEFRDVTSFRVATKLRTVRHTAHATVAVCDVVRDILVKARFAPVRLRRIYNGIDVAAYESAQPAGLRAVFGWPAATRIVGTVANVRPTKGYEYFVRAARAVVDVDPAVRFVAAGDVDPRLGAPILQLIRDLDLAEHVRLVGFRADAAAVLKDFDVFVLASTSEGFPLALLEAMATGRAVVATRCGGPEELVRDGENGFLVPPADAASLSERVTFLLRDPARSRALASAARSTALRFTVESMVDRYAALYHELLSARRAGTPASASDSALAH